MSDELPPIPDAAEQRIDREMDLLVSLSLALEAQTAILDSKGIDWSASVMAYVNNSAKRAEAHQHVQHWRAFLLALYRHTLQSETNASDHEGELRRNEEELRKIGHSPAE